MLEPPNLDKAIKFAKLRESVSDQVLLRNKTNYKPNTNSHVDRFTSSGKPSTNFFTYSQSPYKTTNTNSRHFPKTDSPANHTNNLKNSTQNSFGHVKKLTPTKLQARREKGL